MDTYTVYVHITPNNRYYIGITGKSPYLRWGHNGMGYYDKRRKVQLPFYYAIQKYGWDNISHVILIENLSKDVACECEKYLIKKYDTTNRNYGYNMTDGGEGVCGFTHSDATRARLSYIRKGKHLSEEHKKKISNTLKGRPNTWQKGVSLSDETKKKMSAKLKGHIVTDETKNKIRIANTGNKPSAETRLKLSKNNCMHRQEIRDKMAKSLKKSSKARAEKRKQTIQNRYPEGLHQTVESNLKRSESLKGKHKSEETKQKMRKPKSPQAIENMKKAQKLVAEARKLGMSYVEYKDYLSSSIN